MSSKPVIKIQQLSKCFRVYNKPYERFLQIFLGSRRQLGSEFWALRNISFEVKKGETVGIIGLNGSGKSTLLQLICGILSPTNGKVLTQGRLAALLELGSGFNPEFTGRENIFMNALVLGLTREQINKRYQNIISFADIGSFIDQPVKTYSSGMVVRLAFAVIAHVDADILVIDEALAVGDALFTQKCMRFLRGFMKTGTVLFVSHDTASINNLCDKAIWLHHGEIKMIGKAQNISEHYLQHTLQNLYGNQVQLEQINAQPKEKNLVDEQSNSKPANQTSLPIFNYEAIYNIKNNLESAKGFKTDAAELISIEIKNLKNPNEQILRGGEQVRVRILACALQALNKPILGFVFHDRLGQPLFGENTLPFTDSSPLSVASGQKFFAEFTFYLPMLPNGEYTVFASVAQGELHNNIQHHLLHDALVVNVSSSKVRWGLVGISFERVEMNVYS